MTEIMICPVCRSTLELEGTINFTAASLQEITCPVCGAKIWKAAGFPLSKLWRVSRVVNKTIIPYPEWRALVTKSPGLVQPIPKESRPSDWSIVLKGMADTFKNIGAGIEKRALITGGFILAVLILLFLTKRR